MNKLSQWLVTLWKGLPLHDLQRPVIILLGLIALVMLFPLFRQELKQTYPVKSPVETKLQEKWPSQPMGDPLTLPKQAPKTTLQNNGDEPTQQLDAYGVVVAVQETPRKKTSGHLLHPLQGNDVVQRVTVKLVGKVDAPGLKTGQLVQVENVLSENPAYNIAVQPGAQVLLNLEKSPVNGKWNFYIANRNRTPALIILGTILAIAVLMIGGAEVSKHVLLAVLLLLSVYQFIFPSVLAGDASVVLMVVTLCACFTILGSFIYQAPGAKAFSREQLVVILGSLGGLGIMAAIVRLMRSLAPLDGYTDEALASLWYNYPHMDYWGLFMASTLMTFQGFIFYMAWMLAQNRKEELSFQARFDIVMLRGRRLLGPMLSSLGLLFVGLYLPSLLQMLGTPYAQFANLEKTASMITLAFAGGLSVILTVPLTAFLAAWLLSEPKAS